MTDRTSSALRRYTVPPVAVTAAGLLLLLAQPTYVPVVAYPLLLMVIAGCAFVGGTRAGLLATALSLVAASVLSVEPLRLADPGRLVFALAGLLLVALLGMRVHAERERDSLRQAVAIERERLEAILDSAHIGIGFLDANLRYLEVNEALAEIDGVAVRDHLGRKLEDVTPRLADRVIPILRRALEGEASLATEIASAEGRHYVASYLPLRGAGATCSASASPSTT